MKKLLLLLTVIFLASCSTVDDSYTVNDPSLSFPYNPQNVTNQAAVKGNKVFPWEIWVPSKDMDGLPLVNFNIINADELARKGNRTEALTKYKIVQRARLLPQEEESLIFRIASTQLALGQSKEALTTLSDYFSKHNEAVDFVSPSFCILLGYAYGYNNNFEQSLAWFSRVNKINTSNQRYNLIATAAVKEFLSKVPVQNFEQTASMWSSDDYIRSLIAEERALRSQRGVVSSDPQFASQSPGMDPTMPANFNGIVSVGVLLPITGKYAVLGNNTKNGLDLALQGRQVTDSKSQNLKVELSYKDAGGAGVNTPAQVTEMVASLKPTLLIGPLLSEEAVPAAETARQYKIPMITFSKKSSFMTGNGIFRLGASAQSQVESILTKTFDEMGITQYALVYANDVNGQEFADSIRSELARRNSKLVYERSYTKEDSTSFLSIAQELEQYPVQALIFPDNLFAASRFLSNISPKKLNDIKVIGTASWDDPVQLARYNTILSGAIFVSPFFAASNEENIKNFAVLYKAKYKVQPDFLAAQGYDTGILVLNSLNTSLSQGASFENSLYRYKNYDGLTGKISVQSNGEIDRKFKLLEFKEGQISELLSIGKSNFVMRGNDSITEEQRLN